MRVLEIIQRKTTAKRATKCCFFCQSHHEIQYEWIKCETKIKKIFVQKHKQHKHRRHASFAVIVVAAAAASVKKNQMQHKHGVDCQMEYTLHPLEMFGACTFSHSFSHLKTEQRKWNKMNRNECMRNGAFNTNIETPSYRMKNKKKKAKKPWLFL